MLPQQFKNLDLCKVLLTVSANSSSDYSHKYKVPEMLESTNQISFKLEYYKAIKFKQRNEFIRAAFEDLLKGTGLTSNETIMMNNNMKIFPSFWNKGMSVYLILQYPSNRSNIEKFWQTIYTFKSRMVFHLIYYSAGFNYLNFNYDSNYLILRYSQPLTHPQSWVEYLS